MCTRRWVRWRILSSCTLFGEYDLIAKVETGDFYDLGQVVVQKIRTVEGVIDTQTHPGTTF